MRNLSQRFPFPLTSPTQKRRHQGWVSVTSHGLTLEQLLLWQLVIGNDQMLNVFGVAVLKVH